MNRFLLTFLGLLLSVGLVWAQEYPLVTIQQIQERSQADLQACQDASPLLGDTVRVRGTVMVPGNQAQGASGRWVWMQNGTGPFASLNVRGTAGETSPESLKNLVPGDSIEVIGVVEEFNNETQINPLPSSVGTGIILLDSDRPVSVVPVTGIQLNDATRVNNLPTGERYESQYVEIYNATVLNVNFFSGGNRVDFDVQDESGGVVNIYDIFMAGRLPSFQNANIPGEFGTLEVPNVGDIYDTIRGIVWHLANGCTGGTNRGYTINPFRAEDYVLREVPTPVITEVTRMPFAPTTANPVVVTAEITSPAGTITNAFVYFAVGETTEIYDSVPMTAGAGSTLYSGTIPAQAEGAFVKYYVSATNTEGVTGSVPNVPLNVNPLFYYSRDVLGIVDLQKTPFTNGNSGYVGGVVTVEGVVTASAQGNDLGYVFVQQEDSLAWAGIYLDATTSQTSLLNLTRGQKVRVTATVQEVFGVTTLREISNVTVTGTGTIAPLDVDPNLFSPYTPTLEPFESMLLSLRDPEGDRIFVVNQNADAPSNFAEYRVGTDTTQPGQGMRVLVGRVQGTAFSSLNFSYINDLRWDTTSGNMLVEPIVVGVGDNMASISGVAFFSFGNLKLLPRDNADMEDFESVTSLNDNVFSQQTRVYPNPAVQTLTIETPVAGTVTLYDLTGRVQLQQALRSDRNQVDIARLRAGYYVAVIAGADGTWFHSTRVSVVK